jgi:ADP-heptose:LPS heptosyltransferase
VRRLLIRPGAIGDCILSLPELESARADYTEVWVPRPIVPLIQFADRVRAIADTGLELLGVVDDARVPELESFHSIYSWYGANRPEFRDAVRHLPFTFFPALPINVIGVPSIKVPAVPIEHFAVIHPFSGSAKKNWPLNLYRELAQALDLPVTWIAGPDDSLDGAVRIADLSQLAGWLAAARVYLGNDSGITHLAAALGVPVVAIFLVTDPCVWSPRGDRVAVLENPTVTQVIDAVRAIRR